MLLKSRWFKLQRIQYGANLKITDIDSVLVIDDSRLSRAAIDMLFQERLPQCVVDEAANAEQALEKVAIKHYQVILVDINMPGMDGFALAPLLKQLSPSSYVIFLTANIQDATRRKAIEMGVGFVSKPIKKQTIDDILTQIGALSVRTQRI